MAKELDAKKTTGALLQWADAQLVEAQSGWDVEKIRATVGLLIQHQYNLALQISEHLGSGLAFSVLKEKLSKARSKEERDAYLLELQFSDRHARVLNSLMTTLKVAANALKENTGVYWWCMNNRTGKARQGQDGEEVLGKLIDVLNRDELGQLYEWMERSSADGSGRT